ncbi:SDR family oxidoreductase [Halobacteriovorax sp. HLS]|uniref:SDR family oxidoreductase n=1 Tax=Halobacteriovorax sp. HLS TaxID=2234000 RepID=UPI000FD7BCDF|nr:SDR family oxidoreductase [Halobacteriovorax sp. HLS]
MKILITGATGYLGKNLIGPLSKSHDHLYLLVRKRSLLAAKKLYGHLENITFVKGDLTNPDLLDEVDTNLMDSIESIIHMGAFYDLQGDHKSCFLQNVLGTQNVTFFARLCKNLKVFHYVSTIAVSGDHRGNFLESDFDISQSFSNPYAETKYEAERLVRKCSKDFKIRIYRPGIIIGHSKTGEFDKVDGPYYFWKTLSKFTKLLPSLLKLPIMPLPLVENSTIPLISVDHASQMMLKSIEGTSDEQLECYHLVDKEPVLVRDLIEFSLSKFKIKAKVLAISNHPLIEKSFDTLGLPKEIIHYMTVKVNYDTANAREKLALSEHQSFSEYQDIIIDRAICRFKGGK